MMKKNFTLIELLIVIAIIAILAGMLLPALNAAREKARTISCLNNEKQVNFAFMHYLDRYNGYIPPPYCKVVKKQWWIILRDSGEIDKNFCGSSNDYKIDKKLLACPNMPKIEAGWFNYAMNQTLPGRWNYIKYNSLKGSYSTRMLISDGTRSLAEKNGVGASETWRTAASQSNGRSWTTAHGGKTTNILFGDGHAETVSSSKITWVANEKDVKSTDFPWGVEP